MPSAVLKSGSTIHAEQGSRHQLPILEVMYYDMLESHLKCKGTGLVTTALTQSCNIYIHSHIHAALPLHPDTSHSYIMCFPSHIGPCITSSTVTSQGLIPTTLPDTEDLAKHQQSHPEDSSPPLHWTQHTNKNMCIICQVK